MIVQTQFLEGGVMLQGGLYFLSSFLFFLCIYTYKDHLLLISST